MIIEKNRLMLKASFVVILLTLAFHILGRKYYFFNTYMMHMQGMVTAKDLEENYGVLLNGLLSLPIILFLLCCLFFLKRKDHPIIPGLITLLFTFGSISIIAGATGRVELHFSIFMVIAALAYYENIRLILLMATIFTVHHIVGFLFLGGVVYGMRDVSFSMLCLHALFLVLTTAATSWQIYSSKKIRLSLELAQQGQRKSIIENITGQISNISTQVIATANVLNEQAIQTSAANKQSLKSIQQVSAGMDIQLESTEKNVSVIHKLTNYVKGMTQSAYDATTISNQSEKNAEQGQGYVARLLKQMEEINESTDHSYQSITLLNEQSKMITNILEVITTISEQTNLLALNAAIEAARAGDHGRGFAVVADEVKKLAEQSSHSAKQIKDLISSILENTTISVGNMNKVKENVLRGFLIAQETRSIFNEIVEHTQKAAEEIKKISLYTNELNNGFQHVSHSIDEVTNIARDSASNTQQIVVSSEENEKSIEEISNVAVSLKHSAQELGKIIELMKQEKK
ncbi:methyl-accepting chemotaxis protein [Heyndrickxia oleronia]|uniref:methyl-accepting chemotaxis protein n=1 Tax=Heyndrickxia oleronia TaxID=38875 RepID=UPI001B25E2FD|nr:methyl-accepting chemotaxis protein [Heyndrickxia oleronia]GIN40177.1 hypothetical protein J19TS1_31260 [Heyndrickxia oleronia]